MTARGRAAVTAGLAALIAFAAVALPAVAQVVGPLAAATLWLPVSLWSASLWLLGAGRRRVSAAVGLAARVAWLVVLVLIVVGPGFNAVDAAFAATRDVVSAVGDTVRRVVVAVVGVVAIGFIVLHLVAPSESQPTARATVRSAGGVHPVLGVILRAAARGLLLLAGVASWIVVMTVAWLALGWWGLRLALDDGDVVGGRLVTAVLAARSRVLAAGFRRVGGAWLSRPGLVHGVWVRPAWIARDERSELVDERAWDGGTIAEDAELVELGRGLLAAYDVALQVGARPTGPHQDARNAPPPVGPYQIEIRRAWSRPDYHAVVLAVSPAKAASQAARVGLDQLVPVLDAVTSWTTDDLRGLHLSDKRIADDELRGGATGLFVALDRAPAMQAIVDPDPIVAAVDRALGEAGLRGRFRQVGREDGVEADVIEYRAPFRTSAEWRELETTWKGLQPAVALFARTQAIRLETRLDPYAFLVVVPKPAPEFPSREATAFDPVFERYGPALRRHPLRFVIGLDHRAEPVFLELGHETPHLLVAGGTGSGKSRSGVFSPLLQLLELNSPDRLGVWLLDSVKRELSSLFGEAPHLRHKVVAEDGEAVVAMFERFAAEMGARYRELGGREFDPSSGQSQLAIVEEWGDLVLLLEKSDLERVVKAVTRIGQLGRAAGFHLVLVTQKGSAEVIPPRLKSNFKGRLCGYFPSASDYGIVLDQHRRLLPNVKGRLAVSDGSGITVCQGLYADNDTIQRRLAALGAAGARRRGQPEKRWPTQGDIDRLDDATLVSLLQDWQEEAGTDLTVTVRGLAERIRSLGLTPGRTERLTDALARLEASMVLERTSSHPTAPRRLAAARADVPEGSPSRHT